GTNQASNPTDKSGACPSSRRATAIALAEAPDERFGIVVGLGKEALDGGLEIDERSEHPTLQSSLAQLGEEARDRIEPGGGFRRVVEHQAGMAIEPGAHLGVIMAAVIVEDDVDELAGPGLGLDRVEGANELLMPVALHAAADDF